MSRRVRDGFPTIPALDVTLADNPSGSVSGVDPNYRPGYAQQFNLTIERELPASLLPLNTAQFDLPNVSIGTAAASTITSIVGTPRQIQFGLKALF